MKSLSLTMGLLVIGVSVFGCSQQMSGQGDAGWITLLDGSNPKTLDNWNRIGDANWRVEDGTIVVHRDTRIARLNWADHTTNSGIFIRDSDPKNVSGKSAYEVNINDQRPDTGYGTGAIPNVAKVSPNPKAGGKWNTYEITARGPQLIVMLNGIKTVDIQNSKFPEGHISLQFGNGDKGAPGGAIKWRIVQVRPL